MASDGTVEYTRESFASLRQASKSTPCLVVISGPQAGLVHEITEARSVLGRESSSSQVTFNDQGVSRNHAEISWQAGVKIEIRDLESTNGLRINGVAVASAELKDGDIITLSPETSLHFTMQRSDVSKILSELSNKSFRDPETGALILESFLERLAFESEASFAVLDVDQSGYVADLHGALAAQALVAQVAEAVTSLLPEKSLVGRYGTGFVAYSPLRALQAQDHLERIRSHIAAHNFRVSNRAGATEFVRTTITCGLAEWRPPSLPMAVVSRAEEALATAKRMGRNRIEVHPLELWKKA